MSEPKNYKYMENAQRNTDKEQELLKNALYILYNKGITTEKGVYNKGLGVFKEAIEKFKVIKPFITIHQPDMIVKTQKCSMRLWMTEPFVGESGHPDGGGNHGLIAEEWLSPEGADEFIKEISFIKFIETKGEGGNFAKKGTKIYQVE